MECSLSQQPFVTMYLNMPQDVFDFSVHDCLLDSVSNFENDKILAFIPPSGNTSILYYK